MSTNAEILGDLYKTSDDPWGYRSRWYERRKRALLLAALPRETFQNALEIGCSNGEMTAALAMRSVAVVATDENADALAAASERLSGAANVELLHQRHPAEWPSGAFDLIVFSELGYYFTAEDLRKIATRMRHSLLPDGSIVLCHWRWPIDHCELTGDDVHRIFEEALGEAGLHCFAAHLEADFRLAIWSADPQSIAMREGLA